MTDTARIIFAGSPEFAVPPLQSLIDSPHEVVAVLTQPDRPAGRGRKLTPSPVKLRANWAGLDVLHPTSLDDPDLQAQLAALKPDLMVVVAYGMLLPKPMLELPRLGCINLHASLLPRWRGAAPIQAAILAGDEQTGITLMQMDEGLDTGPIYSKSLVEIEPDDTGGELQDRLARRAEKMLDVYLEDLLNGILQRASQSHDSATYAGKIKKADGLIDWSDPAIKISRQIRAYNPWPVAHTHYKGELLRCLEGSPIEAEQTGEPGSVIELAGDALHIQTGEGVLALSLLQRAGGKAISANDFANSVSLDGLVLGR